ncbi:MAG TPA: DNA repair protein RecO [bacterium]|nr:DNA repair protein RecO [bacterium]
MYFNEQAIILSRQTFGEDDLLLKVYSAHHGKLILKARGAKKILSKLAGHLEPISLSYFNLVQGKNMLQIIGAETVKSYVEIKNDLGKMDYVWPIVGLFNQLILENHSDKRIFILLEKYLDFFNHKYQNNSDIYATAKLAVSFKLLDFLGLNPALKTNFSQEINFIIKSSLTSIAKNQTIKNNFPTLKRILDQEIKLHLH